MGTGTGGTNKMEIVFLCGPPGAGKTTHVTKNRKKGDVIWDPDSVLAAIEWNGVHPEGGHIPAAIMLTQAMQRAFFSKLEILKKDASDATVWVIVSKVCRWMQDESLKLRSGATL